MTAPAPIGLDRVLRAMHHKAPDVFGTHRTSTARLDLLLFLVQGHNLAHYGQPLFVEALFRTGGGVAVSMPDRFDRAEAPGAGHFNTIADAMDRYADLALPDLRALVQVSTPWQQTAVGQPIGHDALQSWFLRAAEMNDPDDERPSVAAVRRFHTRAVAYR